MESKKEVMHTPEPWFYQEDSDEYTHIIRPESNPGMIVVHLRQDSTGKVEADARRIVACVNACAGITNESLERGWGLDRSCKWDMITARHERDDAIEQRDELLAALKAQEELSRNGLLKAGHEEIQRVDAMRKAAIAKCEVKS